MNIEVIEQLSPTRESTACKLLASLIEDGSFTMPPYPSNKAAQLEQLEMVTTLCRMIEFSLDKRKAELAGWVNGVVIDNRAIIEQQEKINRERYFGTDSATVARKERSEIDAQHDAENAKQSKLRRKQMLESQEQTLRAMITGRV